MSPASNRMLHDRGAMLQNVRAFFHEKNVLEVDCPLLSHFAPIDEHIDLFEVKIGETQKGYLHSSPEYGMKRLLSTQIGSIYQLSHVYRKGEAGVKHSPEFTLIEWYRPGFSFEDFMEEILSLLSLFLGELPSSYLTYRRAFELYTEIDYKKVSSATLIEKIESHGIAPETNEKEALLNILWGCVIEPKLGNQNVTVITNYPPEQAALAKISTIDGEEVAERFEIYVNGMELGNGYHELTDPIEQKRRLHESNEKREERGKEKLPIDTHFLKALETGIPDSYGIAIGFDRLMMLRHQVKNISDVLPFFWHES